MLKNSEALFDMFTPPAPPLKKPTADDKRRADEHRQAAHKMIREDSENWLLAFEYQQGPWFPFEKLVKLIESGDCIDQKPWKAYLSEKARFVGLTRTQMLQRMAMLQIEADRVNRASAQSSS
jgi:hypothetical protein